MYFIELPTKLRQSLFFWGDGGICVLEEHNKTLCKMFYCSLLKHLASRNEFGNPILPH